MARTAPRFRRAPGVVCVAGAHTLLVVARDGASFELSGDEAALAARILERLVEGPATAAALAEALGPTAPPLLARLADAGLVRAEPADATAAAELAAPPPCPHVVLGVCGAVQAVDVTPYVHALQRSFGNSIDVILSRGAQKFVKAEGVAALGVEVWTDEYRARGSTRIPHIHLAERAGVVLVLPASAHALMRLATGACCDLLSLVVAATSAPVVVAPSMNGAMWRHPAIARNVQRLRDDGVLVIEPIAAVAVSTATTGLGGIGVRPGELMGVLRALFARRALTSPKNGGASGQRRRR